MFSDMPLWMQDFSIIDDAIEIVTDYHIRNAPFIV